MKNFALIGASGYIAPRHLKAIKETNNNLVAALDNYDGVGILDSYFPNTDFFTQTEIFDRHIEKLKYNKGLMLNYVSICTPNYLHDSHIRMALRLGADAICEKPLVLNPWNLDALKRIENESGKKIWNILQLRLHKTIIDLKKKVETSPKNKIFDIDLTYITSRGKWYYVSWKGNKHKSGGIATNIGIHFFDMLLWIFGEVKNSYVEYHTDMKASGHLELEKANVNWNLSIDSRDLPHKEWKAFRSITVDGKEIEFSDGFTDLHTESYRQILNGNGFRISDAEPSLKLVHQIRNAKK